MGVPFKTIISGQSELDRVQNNISTAFGSISGPFIGGNLLTQVSIQTTATVVNHGLSRTPQVWVICDQDTLTTLKRVSWNTSSITLLAGSACTVSLWVN